MDFKGVTWAGNIYQKFEAMCLEVEEAMYQDTVKYMENQVQKVGVSVQKFYSEVMEDLLPPSCVDPMNIAAGDLCLSPYGHTDVIKKPIPGILDSHCNRKKKENESQVMSNVTAEKESSLSNFDINSLSPPVILVKNKGSESCATASKKVGVHRRPVGIKRISKNNSPSKDSSRITTLPGDRRSKLASSDMRSSSRVASDDINVMSSSDLDVSREAGQAVKGNIPIPDSPIESPASEKMLSAESVRQNKDDLDCASPASDKILSAESVRQNKDDLDCISPACDKILSAESVRQNKDDSDCISPASNNNLSDKFVRLKGDAESTSFCPDLTAESTGSSVRCKACNLESEVKEVMISNEGPSMKNGLSNSSTTSWKAESWDKEIIKSNEDGFNMEVIENEEFDEPRLEDFEPVESLNLEESCVLVEGDKLHCVPHETRKHKSYKKKIREALSSKLRSRKDNRRVSQHEDIGGENDAVVAIPVLAVDAEKQKVLARDSFESDWELL